MHHELLCECWRFDQHPDLDVLLLRGFGEIRRRNEGGCSVHNHALHPAFRCLSTSGARPDPQWLSALVEQGLPIYCGFDADPTGDAMAQRMRDLHPSILRLRPAARDWNDLTRQLAR